MPAEGKVSRQIREEVDGEGHQTPGCFLEPEINLNLARLETEVKIPESQGLNDRNANESAFSDTFPSLRSASAINMSHDMSTAGYLE